MFDPVDPKQSFPDLEKGILAYWQRERTFRHSMEQRKGGDVFNFYDGPPFATGLPHYGHLLAGTIKDVIPRYQSMRGKLVQRRFGWDCHGLPIENLIEKEHDIKNKRQIEEMGVATFNTLCRASVQRYTKEWRHVVERMGRWVDMDWDYRTMDSDYMESIWWAFAEVYRKGLLYEGQRPISICPRCATPLSNFEVGQGYKDVTDLSATAMFALKDEPNTFVLAWTTTPWTLPGNLFLAVHPEVMYVRVACEGKTIIVAKDLVEHVFSTREHAVEGRAFKGGTLVGTPYTPLFPYFAAQYAKKAFRVVPGDFVTTEEGTGVVHIAPGFGEDDFHVGKCEGIDPPLQHVTIEGRFTPEVTDFAGMDVKPSDDVMKTDRLIVAWLKEKGLLFSSENYRHSYPHCWRCDSPLLNYATRSWFVSVEKIKDQLLTNAERIKWMPAHLKHGRFGKWLEGARDWSISRNRYWGTPLPIWRGKDVSEIEVIGSRDALMAHKRLRFTKVTMVHHAQSEGNVKNIYQGTAPGTSLTKQGKKDTKAAAKLFASQPVDIIYTSPLARAQETAAILAEELGARVVVDERLREVHFGSFDNTELMAHYYTKAEHLEHLTAEQRAQHAEYWTQRERWEAVAERLDGFLSDILPKHRSQHVLLVSHGDPIVTIRKFFTGEPLEKLRKQPPPGFVTPESYFWDHTAHAPLDLHKEFVDTVQWPGTPGKGSMSLTLVRHGETQWNEDGKIQGGEVNNPLNADGKEQAKNTAKELKKQSFDVVLSSDLARAQETATIIAQELGISHVEYLASVRERTLGEWTGKHVTEVPLSWDGVKEASRAFHYATPPKGESLSTFLARIEAAMEHIRATYAGKKVLLIAHQGVVLGMKALAENLSYGETLGYYTQNGESVQIDVHPPMKRIPDVLDCWFESGSMPYAQSHFPFQPPVPQLPPGFPADFIAEGVDQTRLWFYTLHILSTILFDEAAYKNVVVNGIVLAEDGKKMSKRLKNYPDPLDVLEKYGADALRFSLMSSPAVRAEDLRFSEKTVEEALRSILLPLWNAYGFFVTYAQAAGFEPTTRHRPSAHPLDQWIRAEVQDLVNRMTEQLDAYDLSASCHELHDTIDALTNWYIRLSRRRFAGKGTIDGAGDVRAEDQHDALTTLYDVLLTLSQILAPFCPFITDAIYLNLTGERDGSVHLTDWPATRALEKKEKALLSKNRLLRRIVSLGLTVRSEQKVKVRQPLAKATMALPPALQKEAALTEEDLGLLRQELNVKELVLTDDPGSLGERIAQVNARAVGPRLGGRVQEIIAAGKRGEFEEEPDGSILILDERLAPGEFSVLYRGREGENVAAEYGIVVSVDTRISKELKLEGQARDLIRGIQRLRKEAGLTVSDTIFLNIEGANDVVRTFGELIAQETKATLGSAKAGAHTADDHMNGPHAIETDEGTVHVRFARS